MERAWLELLSGCCTIGPVPGSFALVVRDMDKAGTPGSGGALQDVG